MGDYNERVNKRLRMVESQEKRAQEQSQANTQQESDLYEHVKQGEEHYDAQTYGKDCIFCYLNDTNNFAGGAHSSGTVSQDWVWSPICPSSYNHP